jgi:small-conductance mechanosensitive channel
MEVKFLKSRLFDYVVGIVCLLLVCALLGITVLKENKLFWRAAGGYPIWQRELLQAIYYPYIILVMTTVGAASYSVLCTFITSFKVNKAWILLVCTWGLLICSIGLLVSNNLVNVWKGRPLHFHPETKDNPLIVFRTAEFEPGP